jgi:uncharacterized protein YodC (DUF2158 family)
MTTNKFVVGARVRQMSGGGVMTILEILGRHQRQYRCTFDKPELESRWFTPQQVKNLWFVEQRLEVVRP